MQGRQRFIPKGLRLAPIVVAALAITARAEDGNSPGVSLQIDAASNSSRDDAGRGFVAPRISFGAIAQLYAPRTVHDSSSSPSVEPKAPLKVEPQAPSKEHALALSSIDVGRTVPFIGVIPPRPLDASDDSSLIAGMADTNGDAQSSLGGDDHVQPQSAPPAPFGAMGGGNDFGLTPASAQQPSSSKPSAHGTDGANLDSTVQNALPSDSLTAASKDRRPSPSDETIAPPPLGRALTTSSADLGNDTGPMSHGQGFASPQNYIPGMAGPSARGFGSNSDLSGLQALLAPLTVLQARGEDLPPWATPEATQRLTSKTPGSSNTDSAATNGSARGSDRSALSSIVHAAARGRTAKAADVRRATTPSTSALPIPSLLPTLLSTSTSTEQTADAFPVQFSSQQEIANVVPTPEPSGIVLLGITAGAGILRRRRGASTRRPSTKPL